MVCKLNAWVSLEVSGTVGLTGGCGTHSTRWGACRAGRASPGPLALPTLPLWREPLWEEEEQEVCLSVQAWRHPPDVRHVDFRALRCQRSRPRVLGRNPVWAAKSSPPVPLAGPGAKPSALPLPQAPCGGTCVPACLCQATCLPSVTPETDTC